MYSCSKAGLRSEPQLVGMAHTHTPISPVAAARARARAPAESREPCSEALELEASQVFTQGIELVRNKRLTELRLLKYTRRWIFFSVCIVVAETQS